MRNSDIARRSLENIKRNKGRSGRTILSISIASCCIIVMLSLIISTGNILKDMGGNMDSLLTVRVRGTISDYLNLPTAGGATGLSLNESDIDFLTNDFKDEAEDFYIKNIIEGFNLLTVDDYVFKTTAIAVSQDYLKNMRINYCEGGAVKDINGAIVSRSFIEKALTKQDYEKVDYSSLKNVDVLGKTLNYEFHYIEGEGKSRQQKSMNIPIRVDGIINDDYEYFGEYPRISDDNKDTDVDTVRARIFNDSVIYIPRERIEELSEMTGSTSLLINTEVILHGRDINAMDGLISRLKAERYDIISGYDDYLSAKSLNFTLKLVMGVLGVCIAFTAIVGIINTMIISILERKKEIGIFKSLGMNPSSIERIYIFESAIMGAVGGIIASALSILLVKLINTFGANKSGFQIASMSWYVMILGVFLSALIAVLASLPWILKISKMDIRKAVN